MITIVFPGSGNGLGLSNQESAAIGEPLFLKLRGEGFAYEVELLSRFRSRQIAIPANKDALERKLFDWVQELVDSTPHPPRIEGLHPASYLMANADGVNTLLYAPVPMALADKDSSILPRTVYADCSNNIPTRRNT